MGPVQDTANNELVASGRASPGLNGPGGRSTPPSVSPPLSVGGAMRRHPFLLMMPVLLLAGAAVVLGLYRAPTFTAETRLGVGRIDVSSQAIPGVVAAYQSLAATYSRIVNADGVVDPIAARMGLASPEVADAISASPIPDSAIIRLKARSETPEVAVRMANLAGSVLARYVGQFNRSGGLSTLLDRFRVTAAELADAQQARDAAQQAHDRSPTEESRKALSQAAAEYEVASIRFSTIRDQISQGAQGSATTDAIHQLNAATAAVSDRNSVLQRLVLVGALAGLALGTLLAITRERWKRRRATA